MLNKKLLIAMGIAAVSTSYFSGTATAAKVIAGTANANILQTISIVVGTDVMDFGDIVPDASPANVVLSAATGNITASGLATTSGTTAKGDFDVSGSDNISYLITMPADNVASLVDIGGNGGLAMDLINFTSDQASDIGTLDGTGNQTIAIGATLVVGGAQVESTYQGTYNVSVEYQ
jgi:hypothetical protein